MVIQDCFAVSFLLYIGFFRNVSAEVTHDGPAGDTRELIPVRKQVSCDRPRALCHGPASRSK